MKIHDTPRCINQHSGGCEPFQQGTSRQIARWQVLVRRLHDGGLLFRRLPAWLAPQHRKVHNIQPGCAKPFVNPPFLGQRLEHAAVPPDGFCIAQHHGTTLFKGEMKQGDDPLLGFGFQIDQQIAACHQIEMRKWRVTEQILRRKNHGGAKVFLHLVGRLGRIKEPAFAGGIEAGHGGCRIDPFACGLQVVFAGVSCKNLHIERLARQRCLFCDQHGHGIGFFPGGTARHPGTDGRSGFTSCDKRRNHNLT